MITMEENWYQLPEYRNTLLGTEIQKMLSEPPVCPKYAASIVYNKVWNKITAVQWMWGDFPFDISGKSRSGFRMKLYFNAMINYS